MTVLRYALPAPLSGTALAGSVNSWIAVISCLTGSFWSNSGNVSATLVPP